MTLKKSMISIAAAGVIAAGLTGCGSSSSSSGGGTTTQPTSITATDGYVINYGVTVTYKDTDGNETNVTRATTGLLNSAVTKNTKAAGASQVAGSATMNLAAAVTAGELTQAQLDNLVSVNLTRRAETRDGTTITYETYFDADGNGEFNTSNGDVAVPNGFAMTAPSGYKNITPITTIVNARINTLTAGDTNDSNRSEVEALALTQIADGLGLTADKIKNVDPMNTISTDKEYALINAMLGQILNDGETTAVATELASATKPTTVSAALDNIASGATASKKFFENAADQLSADSSMINEVPLWNLDALRNGTGAVSTFTPTYLTATGGDFNVSAITMNSNDVATVMGSGAKVDAGDLDDFDITFNAGDVNVTNKPLTLLIDVRGQKRTKMLDDANVTSLTIKIPLEINNTIDATNQIDMAVAGTVTWEGVDGDGNTFTGDVNKTAFTDGSIGAALTPFVVPANTGSALVDFNMDDIITAVDTNASSKFEYVANGISSIKIALADDSKVLARTNTGNTATQYWGNLPVLSVLGGISTTGKTLFTNTLTDGRSGGALANSAPRNVLNIGGTIMPSSMNKAMTGLGTAANPYIIYKDTNISLSASGSVIDTAEKNTTMAITASSTAFDLNKTLLIDFVKNTANAGTASAVALGSEFNLSSVPTTVGDVNYTITTVFTDEFGESNSSGKYYFMLDRPMYVYGTDTSRAFGYGSLEANTSKLLADYDTNTTLSTITTGSLTILENNATNVDNITIVKLNELNGDINISSGATGDASNAINGMVLQSDGTLEINGTVHSDINFTVIAINVTDAHGVDFNQTYNDTNISY